MLSIVWIYSFDCYQCWLYVEKGKGSGGGEGKLYATLVTNLQSCRRIECLAMQLYDLAVVGEMSGFNVALDALPAAVSPAELSVLHRPSGEGAGLSFWIINEMNFIYLNSIFPLNSFYPCQLQTISNSF